MTLANDLEDAWVTVARLPPELRSDTLGPLPPRLWGKLRIALQTEYRRATGEPNATLAATDSNATDTHIAELEAEVERLMAQGNDSPEKRVMPLEELEALPAHPLAKWREGLDMGIHRIHWEGGGTSIAAVGQMSDGRKWLAPCNWLGPLMDPASETWAKIERTELLIPHPEPDEARILSALVQP